MVLFLIYNQCLVCFLTYIHKGSVSACVIEVFVMLRMLGFCSHGPCSHVLIVFHKKTFYQVAFAGYVCLIK